MRRFLVVAMSLVGVAACSTGPDIIGEEAAGAPGAELAVEEALALGLPWLGGDSDMVMAWVGEPYGQRWGEALLWLEHPRAEPGERGTRKGAYQDMQALVVDYLGYDALASHAMVVGVSLEKERVTAVSVGDFDLPLKGAHLEMVEIDGQPIYRVDLGEETDWDALYMVAVESPRQAVVWTTDPQVLVNGPGEPTAKMMEMSSAFVGDRGAPGWFLGVDISAVMGLVDGAEAFDEARGLESGEAIEEWPNWAVLSYGDALGVTLGGDEEVLAGIAETVDAWAQEFRRQVADDYGEARQKGPVERLEAVYLYHATEALVSQLTPRVGPGQLRYELAGLTGASPLWTLGAHGAIYGAMMARRMVDQFTDALADLSGLTAAERDVAKTEINQLTVLVEVYYLSSWPQQLPEDLDDLTAGEAPLITAIPTDPWGLEYVYRRGGERGFEVFSVGPDGVAGTEDDVRVE